MKRILLLSLLLLPSPANAEGTLHLLLSGGITGGGDTLAQTSDNTDLTAGGLIYGSIGGLYELENSPLQIQTSLGYHFDTVSTTSGDLDFSRLSVEVIPFYKFNESVRLGIGYSRIFNIEYTDPIGSIQFNDADAIITELSFNTQGEIWWGFRVAKTEFIMNRIDGFSIGNAGENFPVDADYFGVIFHIMLK